MPAYRQCRHGGVLAYRQCRHGDVLAYRQCRHTGVPVILPLIWCIVVFRLFRKIAKKQLLASSSMSIRPSAWNDRAPKGGGIFMIFDFGVFFKNLSRKFEFLYNMPRITVLYMKTDRNF